MPRKLVVLAFMLFGLWYAVPASAQPCTGLCLKQVACVGNATSSITGTVYAPNGTDPLPNVLVYVPNAQVVAFAPGVACEVAGQPASGSPLVETTTDYQGRFTLRNMPVGVNIPIVIQAGRWRRQFTVPNVAACVNTPVNPASSRFPRNRSEGDIPKMAIVTGAVDATECVLRKIGIADSEFSNPGGVGRIQLYRGDGNSGAQVNLSTPFENQLWSSQASLNQFDMAIFACQGSDYPRTQAAQQVLQNYANAGGRIFGTHFAYTWLINNGPFSSTAQWNPGQTFPADQNASVNLGFAKGQQLASWLQVVGASTTFGQIPISTIRKDQNGVVAPTQSWLSINNPAASVQFTFNTPVGAAQNLQCGRVLFNEYHVEPTGDTSGLFFPNECAPGAMTPQEKLLEFDLFDLGTFVAPDVPATVSVTFNNAPNTFVQGDDNDVVTINVTNTNATLATDQTLKLTAAIPNGMTVVSMAGANANTTHWLCSSATASCTRTAGLAGGASDPITLVLGVAPNAPVGTVTLSATAAGGGLAANVVGLDPIPVRGVTTLSWSNPAAISYSDALDASQLNAVANVPGTYVYLPAAGTVLPAGVQALNVTFTPTDLVNYQVASTTVALEVLKATTAVTVACPSAPQPYTGLPQAPCAASYLTSDGLTGPLSVSYTNDKNAGTATADASYAGDANHEAGSNTSPFTISMATSSVTVTCPAASQPYTGAAQAPCTAGYSTSDGLSGALPVAYASNTNVGSAGANASYAGDSNHLPSANTGSFAIIAATSTVTVTCPPSAQPYSGAAQTPCTAGYSTSDGLSGALSVLYSDNTIVGTATAKASYAGDSNHGAGDGLGTFAISAATSTVTVTCPSALSYTGAAQAPCTAAYTTSDGLSGALLVSYLNNINAGTATATAAYAGDGNHANSTNNKSFAIGAATSIVTVACPPSPQPYNGAAQSPCNANFTTSDGLSGSLSVSYASNTNVGTATANASYAGDGNHASGGNGGTFAIAPAVVTAKAGSGTSVFDGLTHLPLACGVSGAYFGDLTCTNNPAAVGPAIGTTTIVPVVSSASGSAGNFAITLVNGSFTIAVPTNNAPVANNDAYPTQWNTVFNVPAAGVLANDTDSNHDPLTSIKVSNPAHGTVTLNANGSFSYKPNANYSGLDSFTYMANDGQANSNVATVKLTIVSPCHTDDDDRGRRHGDGDGDDHDKADWDDCRPGTPTSHADEYHASQNTALSIAAKQGVLKNDGKYAATAVLFTAPLHGTVTLGVNGDFVYTPAPNYLGNDVFYYVPRSATGVAGAVTSVKIEVERKSTDRDKDRK